MTAARTCPCSRVLLAVGVLVALGAETAQAAPTASAWVDGYNSKVRLVAGARAGKPVAGIEIRMAEGWKTYWRSPGDAGGVPPHFDWAGSTNLARAEVLFPAPRRMSDPAGDAVGYKGSVVFPVIIAAEDPAKPVRLALAFEFGICKEICVPAEAKIELELPVAMDEAGPDILKAIDGVPRKASLRRSSDPVLGKGTARLGGEKPILRMEASFPVGATEADAFVEAPEGIYLPLPRRVGEAKDGKLVFEVDLTQGADPADLKGKTLTVTLVSATGQSEAAWTID